MAKHKLPLRIEIELRDALKSARLESASFSMNKEEDERIKRTIKPYLDSWVAARIDRVLRWNDGTEYAAILAPEA